MLKSLAKKILVAASLLSLSYSSFAGNVEGYYCDSDQWLVIHVMPKDSNNGSVSVFNADVGRCMREAKPYVIKDGKLMDINGMQADIKDFNTLSVYQPRNWVNVYSTSNCTSNLYDPC